MGATRGERVLFDSRWAGAPGRRRQALGIARTARELVRRLDVDELESDFPLLHPLEPLWLAYTLRRRRPRAFFSPGFNGPPFSAVPVFFMIHDLIHLHTPWERSRRKRLYYTAVVRPAARTAAAVLTGSEFSRDAICEWSLLPREQVVVVRHGISEAFSPEGPRHMPGYEYVLYVGNQKPHKNVVRLVQGYGRCSVRRSVHLVLVGPAEERVRAEVARLGLSAEVVFLDRVDDAALPALYRGARALVHPSIYEGFGLPPLEAMASGTPVASSHLTALREVVGDAALELDPFDPDSIANAIDVVVSDEQVRATLRSRGLAHARQFDWNTVAEHVRSVLAERS